MTPISATLNNPQQGRIWWAEATRQVGALLHAGHRLSVSIKPATRSLDQNALTWSCLTDLSKQVDWYGQKLSPEDWKDMASAALRGQRVVPAIQRGDGKTQERFVVLGQRTSQMTVGEMSELVTFLHAFGGEKGVKWSRTSLGRDVPDEVCT